MNPEAIPYSPRNRRIRLALGISCLLLLACGSSLSATPAAGKLPPSADRILSQPENIQSWLQNDVIRTSQIPDPHWNDRGCIACHSSTPASSSLHLRSTSTNELCNQCHSGKFDHNYIHPSNVKVSDTRMLKRMPKEFRSNLNKGRLSCATCHDISAQCLPERRKEKAGNPRFFRLGPYRNRTDLCYLCHDSSKYQRLNAHDQVTDDGKIRKYSCRLCHANTKNIENATGIEDVDFHVKGSLVRICASCHPLLPHPSGGFSITRKGKEPDHLVVPPEQIRSKMLKSEAMRDIILPLDPHTGKIFCATCHNPHEKGVIKNKAAARGADEYKRLRSEHICTNCHDM
jgi:predicted CXXCH cytochrome family protein